MIWGMFSVTSIQVNVRLSAPQGQQSLPALATNLSLMPGTVPEIICAKRIIFSFAKFPRGPEEM